MNIDWKFIKVLAFNIAETILIFLLGKLLDIPNNFILIVMLTFLISRSLFGKSLHFKTWYRCLIWSGLILLSLFLVLKTEIKLAVLFTIFSAFIMTGKSNIEDMYLWKSSGDSKYFDIDEYIKYHLLSSDLLDFEENLKRKDDLLYLIYKYRFRDNLTFKEMSEKLEMDNARIVEKLDQIALAIRIKCGI